MQTASLKKKADAVIESIEGFQMTEEQKERIRFVRKHLDFVDKLIADIDQTITGMVEPFESAISMLCTIPGVDPPLLLQSSPRSVRICLSSRPQNACAAGRD